MQSFSEDRIELLLRTLFYEKKNADITLDVSEHSVQSSRIYPIELIGLRTAVITKGPSFGPTLDFKDICCQISKVAIHDPITEPIIVVSSEKPSNQFEYELQKYAEMVRPSIDLTKLLAYYGYLENKGGADQNPCFTSEARRT